MGFANEIVGGNTLVREAIQSPNYVAGVSGWTIKRDGTVEFASGTFRGSINIPATGGGSTQINAGWLQLVDAASAGGKIAYLTIFGSSIPSYRSLLITAPQTVSPASSINLRDDGVVDLQGSLRGSSGTLQLQATAITGALSVSGSLNPSGGISNASVQAVLSRFWAWGGTTGSWDSANYVASSIDGSASSNTWRTNPLASQARVGTVIQDVYWRNSVDSGYIGHQAANFTVGSRASTKEQLVDVDEAAGLEVLEGLRKLHPIRYRQLGMDEARFCGPEDVLHQLHPARRALGPVGAIRDYWRQWESSITHYGFTVEDVAGVFPDATVLGDDGLPVGWSVPGLLALVVRAVQQLAARVDDLNTAPALPTGGR